MRSGQCLLHSSSSQRRASNLSLPIDFDSFTPEAGAGGSPEGGSPTSGRDPGRVGFVVITIPSQRHSGASRSQHFFNSTGAARQLREAADCRSCLSSLQSILLSNEHGLCTKSGDARQREDIEKLSPAC